MCMLPRYACHNKQRAHAHSAQIQQRIAAALTPIGHSTQGGTKKSVVFTEKGHLQAEAAAIGNGAAIIISALVASLPEELLNQVAICAMDLDPIKACAARALSSFCVTQLSRKHKSRQLHPGRTGNGACLPMTHKT